MFRFPYVLRCVRQLRLAALALLATLVAAYPTVGDAAPGILVFGDSLSAGYGLRQDAAWPSLLAARLAARHLDYNVVNASISGETTSGGLARLPAALEKNRPAIVIIALGANDGLRGLPLRGLRDNLAALVDGARRTHAKVLLVGQRLPPNYGAYANDFYKTFADVAQEKKTAYVDFLLEGIATRPELFQEDRLHPTAEAQPILLDTVWRGLSPLLK